MSETEKNIKKESIFIPLLLWAVLGFVIGIGIFMVFFNQPEPVPQPPQNITPPANLTPATPKPGVTIISVTSCEECNASEFLLEELKEVISYYGMELGNITRLDQGSDEAKALISRYSIDRLPSMIISSEAGNSSTFITDWEAIGTMESDGAFVYRDVYPPYFDVGKQELLGFAGLIEIKADCSECYDPSEFVDFLKSPNVAMVFGSEESYSANSSEAAALISKYNITRLPAFILSDDAGVYPFVSQAWYTYGTEESDGSFVYRAVFPPFVDLEKNGTVSGLVEMVELVALNCTECYDVGLHEEGLNQSFGMVFANITRYETNSSEGKALIAKYNISAAPTVVLSPDAMLYPGMDESWPQMGTIESDNWLVFRELDYMGTYVNITANST